MKLNITLLLLTGMILFSPEAHAQEPLASNVYRWAAISAERTGSGEHRQFIDGSTQTLQTLKVHATTLHPGEKSLGSRSHDNVEQLIIVKSGNISVTMNGSTKTLGHGSVVLASTGDMYSVYNAAETPASYFVIQWVAKNPASSQGPSVKSSFMADYAAMDFRETAKGGRRQVMRAPTETLQDFAMHITTLNEGVTSHGQHTHTDEEIILVLKGEVEELIKDRPHRLGQGGLIFLKSGDPHGIRNAGKGQCEYYAIRWN